MNSFIYKVLGYLYEPICYWRTTRILRNTKNWKKIQNEELVNILSYAKLHCEYYNKFLYNKDLCAKTVVSVLRSLPLLDKNTIRGNNVQSDEITPDWDVWANTGGSTGEPLRFPRMSSRKSKRLEYICQMALYIKMGYKPFDLIVSLDGQKLNEKDLNNNKYWAIRDKNFPYGLIRYSVLYLDNKSFKDYVNSLNLKKPKFIRSYPSGLLLFCKLLKESGLSLSFDLKGCYLTSENFSQVEKEYISNILNCPVWGQYGHTEASIFAIQEPEDSQYLCSPIYGYTEILNEEGIHVEEGDTGEIVVTGFSNYGLPFIRYKTGDLAVYGGQTDIGETVLKKLLGRDSDFVYDKDNIKKYLVGMIFGAHLHAFDCINAWQIIQNDVGVIILMIVKGVSYNEESEIELRNFFNSNNLVLFIEYVTSIEKTKRGKQKFLIQNIN